MTGPAVSHDDLAAIGATLLAVVAVCARAGHADPASTLDYTPAPLSGDPSDSAAVDIVLDFVAWTGRREALRPGAEDRLRSFVAGSGWEDGLVDATASFAHSP